MTQYFIAMSVPANADCGSLVTSLKAAGLPVSDVQGSDAYPGQIIVVASTALTQAQQTQLNSAVAAWDPRPRTRRAIYAIYNDLTALTATQQGNVWTDFSSGNPAKYLLDQGQNAAAIAVMDWVVKKSGATGAALTDARMRAVAMYVQDNPNYLVHPSFDASINVAGDMPVG